MEVNVRPVEKPVGDALDVEIVERKGLGHPDSICDALAERLSVALSRFYVNRFGFVLHHNVDKALLWGGAATPTFGGGKVTKPIEVYLAGRAIREFNSVAVPVEELAEETARGWLRENLHALDARRHVKVHSLVRPGSAELVELFARPQLGGTVLANDTSIGVGFAPFSELEDMVYAIERHLNSPEVKKTHPETGEDIKVMGVRHGDAIHVTVACAFIGRSIVNAVDYFEHKEEVAQLAWRVAQQYTKRKVTVEVNAADSPDGSSVYVTVTGTSAEAGDDGEAGRGNRANGLITPYRPMTLESVAGKNPISHVGKLYNIAASLIAEDVVEAVPGVAGAECYLASRIGHPIRRPQVVDVGLYGGDGRPIMVHRERVCGIVEEQLDRLDDYWRELMAGTLRVDRWPLRHE